MMQTDVEVSSFSVLGPEFLKFRWDGTPMLGLVGPYWGVRTIVDMVRQSYQAVPPVLPRLR